MKIFCPSIRPQYYEELAQSVKPFETEYINGNGFSSFAALCNKIFRENDQSFFIIANDKARPNPDNIDKMLNLHKDGFGFVALYRMGFFLVDKIVLSKVGLLDERFSDGGYEDNDYYIRLKKNNIGSYINEEINYLLNVTTLWKHKKSAEFFSRKYKIDHRNKKIIVKISDEEKNTVECFDRGKLKNWEESFLCTIPLVTYKAHFEVVLKEYDIVNERKIKKVFSWWK
ncbi:hypothetical protein B4O97_11865 [Marispirochaeta aestuarii]|uniref:Uncharacterized protein n=1 Tax=Marispirochaeta aestuarii TaxID=1963862 RepID=A0A1Y1RWN8_9SPIO|nr:hypothetical protein [Marispirochaeta aestuarii]ORC34637.1 hypothetical protein B4O97_11865 [Marispirochaeta aestuarii]